MIKEDKVSSYYFTILHYIFTSLSFDRTILHYIFTSLSFDRRWRFLICCISYDELYQVSTNHSHLSFFHFNSLTFSTSEMEGAVYEGRRFFRHRSQERFNVLRCRSWFRADRIVGCRRG